MVYRLTSYRYSKIKFNKRKNYFIFYFILQCLMNFSNQLGQLFYVKLLQYP